MESCPSLVSLNLSNTQIKSKGISGIQRHCQFIENLQLAKCGIFSNQWFSFCIKIFFGFFSPMFVLNFGIGINGGRPQIETPVLKECLLYFGHNLRSLDLTAQNVDVTILAVLAQLKSVFYSFILVFNFSWLQFDYFLVPFHTVPLDFSVFLMIFRFDFAHDWCCTKWRIFVLYSRYISLLLLFE